MRKNKMMRLASALLVAVLLSTCAISGTFAKYVTTASAADTARVAKWGVAINSVNAADNTFFKGEYTTDDTKYSATITNSVDSADGADVIAPGTKGDWVNVSVSGTPEVAVKVEYAADLELEGWILGDHTTFYCPVIIIIDGVEYSAAGTGCTTADAFEAYIDGCIYNSTDYELDEVGMYAKDKVELSIEDKATFDKLYNLLDDIEDVSKIYHNVKID